MHRMVYKKRASPIFEKRSFFESCPSLQNLKLPLETGFQYVANKESGAGGSRTRVQTRMPYAFYMLIPVGIFEKRQEPDDQSLPYPLKFHLRIEAFPDYFRFCRAAY